MQLHSLRNKFAQIEQRVTLSFIFQPKWIIRIPFRDVKSVRNKVCVCRRKITSIRWRGMNTNVNTVRYISFDRWSANMKEWKMIFQNQNDYYYSRWSHIWILCGLMSIEYQRKNWISNYKMKLRFAYNIYHVYSEFNRKLYGIETNFNR